MGKAASKRSIIGRPISSIRNTAWSAVSPRRPKRAFGRRIATDVCGPSNIGNLLAAQGVPTICAPGVSFGSMHAANEWADIDSIAPVYAMYCDAAVRFLNRP